MEKTLRPLTPEETAAIQSAAWLHGKNFKSAIHRAWYSGNYSRECLADYSGTLQRMRNSEDGHALLESLRVSDYTATPVQAYAMGAEAAKSPGSKRNPFGVANLADEWRKGYRETAARMDYLTRPIVL